MRTQPDYADALIARWRTKADDYERDGQHAAAAIYRRVADDLEAERTTFLDEVLTITAAAAESGFTTRHLRTLRSEGVITLRRRDLPRRPGHGVQHGPQRVADDVEAAADDILGARRAARSRKAS